MKKRLLVLSNLLLISLSVTACDSFFNPFAMSGFNSKSSDTQSSEITSSSDDQSTSSVENSSSSQMSTSNASSSSFVPVEPNYVSFDIYPFNDTHGNVLDTPGEGISLSKTATALKELSEDKETIYISQGDMWQGGAESNATKGKLMTDWMNQLGFVSMTVGNHEFDWGTSYVSSNAALANFPFLGINVYDKTSNQRVDYLDPSVIVNKNGAKIGIIGSIGDCYSSIAPSMVSDIYFKVGDELSTLVKDEATRLKNVEKCDFVIYSTHFGDEGYDISISDYVDIVFEGHTHENYVRTDSKGIYHVQSAGYNRTIGYIDLTINTTKDTFVINKINPIYTLDYSSYTNDSASEALFTKYASEINAVNENLGYNYRNRNSTYLRNLVASLYLEKGLEKWGSSYNIVLGGGYISCRSPYNLYEGNVIYSDLYTLFPFDNKLQLCYLTGYYLYYKFITTDNTNYFNAYSSYGDSVKESIDMNAIYYVVVDSYTSEYAPNHLTVVEDYSTSGYYARDCLADYARRGGFEN